MKLGEAVVGKSWIIGVNVGGRYVCATTESAVASTLVISLGKRFTRNPDMLSQGDCFSTRLNSPMQRNCCAASASGLEWEKLRMEISAVGWI